MLQTFSTQKWNEHFPDSIQHQAINALEDGQILYFPELTFGLKASERTFLSPDFADPSAKNISYLIDQDKMWGAQHLDDLQHKQLKLMLERFCKYSCELIKELLPHYSRQLIIARTSYRPVQVSSRITSYRKDDKRLHVDAFPSAPNQGKRILRVFANINPNNENRIWRVGESFEQVAKKFLPLCQKPYPGSARVLRLLRITKSYRTLYDHYMLQIHDRMKEDEQYQQQVKQQTIEFPPNSTWIVQTDHVSHAAMSGQFALEQTFYLPVKAMKDEAKSPLRILERMMGQKLVGN